MWKAKAIRRRIRIAAGFGLPRAIRLLHLFVAGLYVYLLLSLFGKGNANLTLTPGHILQQLGDGARLLWSPAQFVARLAEAAAMSPFWLLALLAIVLSLGFGLWIFKVDDAPGDSNAWTPGWIVALGCSISLLCMANTAPASWKYIWHERLLYAASLGSAMTIAGLLALAVERHRQLGGAAFAAVVASIVAPGICFPFAYQAQQLERDAISRQVHAAISRAIPEFTEGAQPYLLLLSDRDPERDLHLVPRDLNFPHVFALRYDIRDFAADAVLHPVAGRGDPAKIRLTESGIVSPLKPGEVIAYDRVVIIRYDSLADSASILDRLPADALSMGNFDIRADMDLATNWALLPVNARE